MPQDSSSDKPTADPTAGGLAALQHWMQRLIMHPGGISNALQCSQAPIESLLTRSQALTRVERLEIYSRAYTSRLLECLRAQFPVLTQALGEDVFNQFAAGYLEQHPSRSYTLNRLGQQFVSYLDATRPPAAANESWPDSLIDLARLEWEFDQVFDGPGVEGETLVTAEQLLAIAPDCWPAARLATVPCLRLLELRHPAHEYYRALRCHETVAPPPAAETFLAITRRDFIVRYFPLSSSQHALLDALMRGQPLGEAISLITTEYEQLETLIADLRSWFTLWTAEGFFQSIDVS